MVSKLLLDNTTHAVAALHAMLAPLPLQLLLQCFEPMLINRAKRVHSPHADFRELLAAARLGLLRAAARYDPQRVAGGKARLYALANYYIRTALRDMLTEVRCSWGLLLLLLLLRRRRRRRRRWQQWRSQATG
jgi:hypothetical protein